MKLLKLLALIAAVGWMSQSLAWAQDAQTKKQAKQQQKQDQKQSLQEAVETPQHGVAVLIPTRGSDARGIITLEQQEDGLHLRGKVVGLSPGLHGFHIHEYGDLRDPQGQTAGGHFNPRGHKHGGPGEKEHHAGDLGNIRANEQGVATVDITAPWLKLHYVLGRSIVVHQGKDDLESQPSGDAGDRVAYGVIGIAHPNPEKQAKKAEKEQPKR